MRLPDWKTFTNAALNENAVKPATTIVNLILLTMLAYSAAQLTWSLLTTEPEAMPVGNAGGTSAAPMLRQEDHLAAQEIANLHLFGRADAVSTAPQPATMPETKLNLVLRAVLASGDTATARAIISDPSGGENFYAIGAQLPGGAELKEIHATNIILYRGGRYETLRLPKETLGLAADIAEEVQSAQLQPQPLSRSDYRDALISDPESVAGMVTVEPVMENGEFKGYRLSPGKDPGFFSQFGLEANDVVTAVNGIKIDSPIKGGVVLRTLGTADQVTVDVIRDGTPQSMVISLH
jgi:general secretion pathway protein C